MIEIMRDKPQTKKSVKPDYVMLKDEMLRLGLECGRSQME
jgi:hypothetical protein